jgi:endonuclease/exonuclease/phosphatase family metal-dependent hydrolase
VVTFPCLRRAALLPLSLLLVVLLPACAPESDADASSEGLAESELRTRHGSLGGRICSWNIRRLGHLFDGRSKDLVATAKIMKDHCDVVVTQEVMQVAGGSTPGFTELRDVLGFSWDGVITEEPAPNETSGNSEHYAFYWRASVASPCPGWTGGARRLRDDDDDFLREPAWFCVKVRDHARELVLASYHAVYGTPGQRRREVGAIDDDLDGDGKKGDVFRAMGASRPGADLLLLADFNQTTSELAEALPTYDDMTVGAGSTLNAADEITTNLFDHVVLPPASPLRAEMKPAEVLDVRSYAKGDSYFRSISDHLPIRITLRPRP